MTKVVTFGAFVEILDGVEGLVHISELANHHVENPREVVQPGDEVRVKVLEIDSERRRLSLSVKRVEGQVLPSERRAAAGETVDPGEFDDVPELGLSEDVFAPPADPDAQPDPATEVAEPEIAEAPAEEPAAEVAEEPAAEVAEEPAAEAAEEPAAEAPEEPAAEAEEPAAAEEPEAGTEAPAESEGDLPEADATEAGAEGAEPDAAA